MARAVLVLRRMAEPESEPEGSTFIVALHVVMWTVLVCGLIAVMVVVMLNQR